MSDEFSFSSIFTGLITLCAAFGGAWAVFKFQNCQNLKTERKHSIVSLQKALFAIGSQYNELIIIYKQHLDKAEKDKIGRHITILPILNYSKVPELDFDSLSFIFGSSDANIVFELMLAQNSYFSVLGLLKKRNEYHVKFQKLISDLEPNTVDIGSLAQKYPEIFESLRTITDQIYELFTHAIEKNRKASEMLTVFIYKDFKEVEPIKFVPFESE